jgi:hypothetical protein
LANEQVLTARQQEVLALLDQTGEMPYADFVALLQSSGKGEHVNELPVLYKTKRTVQKVAFEGGVMSFTIGPVVKEGGA